MHQLKAVCILSAILFLTAGSIIQAEQSILPLSDVKKGMHCYGYSVFSSEEPRLEKLNVEIVGIVRNGEDPSNCMIVGLVDSPSVNRGGIMSGMSGSPVYFEGQLLGAIASAFPYAREPMCGITPIEAMTRLWQLEAAPGRQKKSTPRSDLGNGIKTFFSGGMNPIGLSIQAHGFEPFKVSSDPALSGQWITGSVVHPSDQHLSESSATGTASHTEHPDPSPSPINLQPGDPIGVGLVGGDIRLVAYGTVTHITDDGKLLAFGHQSFGIGSCEMPLFSADVVSFVPNQVVSFKMANLGEPIGKLTFDASAGVAGKLGDFAHTIPVKLTITGLDPEAEIYDFWVLDHEYLTYSYLAQAVNSLITRKGNPWGTFSTTMNLKISLQNGMTIDRRHMAGSIIKTGNEVRKLLSAVDQIQRNPLEKLTIDHLTVNCDFAQETRLLTLDSARVPRQRILPGETIPVIMEFSGDRSDAFQVTHQVTVPDNLPGGQYQLYVIDSETYAKYQAKKWIPDHRLATVDLYIDQLNSYLAADELRIVLTTPARDIRTERFVLPDAPPSLQVLTKESAEGSRQIKSLREISAESIQLSSEVKGMVKIPLQIGRKQEKSS